MFRRHYTPEEARHRSSIFAARTAKVEAHNARHDAGLESWRMGGFLFAASVKAIYPLLRLKCSKRSYLIGLNHFSDLSHEEYVARYASGLKQPVGGRRAQPLNDNDANVVNSSETARLKDNLESHNPRDLEAAPASLDWRSSGHVTPVRDQVRDSVSDPHSPLVECRRVHYYL